MCFRVHLFEVYAYLKIYPQARQWRLITPRKHLHWSRIRHQVVLRLKYLASCIDEISEVFEVCMLRPLMNALTMFLQNRWTRTKLPFAFNNNVIASHDTFPIYVRLPESPSFAKLVFNGKYKAAVLKVRYERSHYSFLRCKCNLLGSTRV